MTNKQRLARLQTDLEWLQIQTAKHAARNMGLRWDDDHPDVNSVQEACPDSEDPIGNIQNVIDDIDNDRYGTIIHLLDSDKDAVRGEENSVFPKFGYLCDVLFDNVPIEIHEAENGADIQNFDSWGTVPEKFDNCDVLGIGTNGDALVIVLDLDSKAKKGGK